MIITLPPQLQKMLVATASKQGMSANEYVLHLIAADLAQPKAVDVVDDELMVFDTQTIQEQIKGFESREQALKNGVVVPKSALVDFDRFGVWLAQTKALSVQ